MLAAMLSAKPAMPDLQRPAPDGSPLQVVVQLLGGEPVTPGLAEAHSCMALRRLDEGAALVHEGTAAHSLYVLRSGSLKSVKTLEDGYEQVMGFAWSGDLLGFDALHNGLQPASIVALEVSTVYALPLSGLQDLRRRCPALDNALQRALSRQLVRAEELTETLAAVASDVRLARFLLSVAARAAEIGWSPRRLRLRMCRRDIASLLGVAHETVSRSFTSMAEAGLLRVDNREVEILDLPGLKGRARSTRAPAEGGAHGSGHGGAHGGAHSLVHAAALAAPVPAAAGRLNLAWRSSVARDLAKPA